MFGTRSVTADLFKILMLWALLGISGCAWLDTWARQKIYRPTPTDSMAVVDLSAGEEHFFLPVPQTGEPQRIALWWLPHATQNAPTLLYLHGTFRNLAQNLPKINALREAGFAVLAVDYRGWGQSSPIVPSEQSILTDARIAWDELLRREPRAGQRVIYGHSMGSGVAVALASELPGQVDYGALILESAFTSFAGVAGSAGFLASVLSGFSNERFASIDKIAQVHAPLLMIHGSHDRTVPMQLGQQLFEAANQPKQWLTIEGGQHSDLQRVGQAPYQAALAAFKARYLSQPEQR